MEIYSKNFSVKELACKCDHCQNYPIAKMDVQFMHRLEKLRLWLAAPMIITSGYRCRAHNTAIGGSKNSYHMLGRAVDVKCTDSRFRASLVEYAFKVGMYGIGISAEFIHIDNRPLDQSAMWHYF